MRRFTIAPLLTLAFLALALSAFAQKDTEYGSASYYHDSFQGNETAYGDTYDMKQMTAAHRQHPYGTMLKVTRLDNNRSVVVKVTDKGPYKRGRVIDLSKAAAERLDLLEDGVAKVKVEVVSRSTSAEPERSRTATATSQEKKIIPRSYENTGSRTAPAESRTTGKPAERTAEASTREKTASRTETRTSAKSTEERSKGGSSARLVGKEYQKYGLYKIALEKPGKEGFAVQVASLTNYENVFQQVADLQAKWFDNILISIEEGRLAPTYKVMLGPFASEAAAENYRKNLMKKHRIKGFVVDLTTIQFTR